MKLLNYLVSEWEAAVMIQVNKPAKDAVVSNSIRKLFKQA